MKETVKGLTKDLKKTIDRNLEGQDENFGWKSAVSAVTTIGIIGMVGAYALSRGGRRTGRRLAKSAVQSFSETQPSGASKKSAAKKSSRRKSSKSRGTGAHA